MTSTQQAARAAAQLHEAAQDAARVAARRNAQAEGRIAELPMQQGRELTEGLWPKRRRRRAPEEWEEKQAERSADAVKDARIHGPDRYRYRYRNGKDDPR